MKLTLGASALVVALLASTGSATASLAPLPAEITNSLCLVGPAVKRGPVENAVWWVAAVKCSAENVLEHVMIGGTLRTDVPTWAVCEALDCASLVTARQADGQTLPLVACMGEECAPLLQVPNARIAVGPYVCAGETCEPITGHVIVVLGGILG